MEADLGLKQEGFLGLFWGNVDVIRKQNGITWTELVGGQASMARRAEYNVSLKMACKIADKLGVDVTELFLPL